MTVMPYGACIAAQTARDAGHEVRFLDLMFESDPRTALETACRSFRPDVAGFSIRNIDNNDMRDPVAFAEEAAPLIGYARRACSARIVLGGAAMAVMPEGLLRRTGAEWGVLGDAAAVFPRFLSVLAAGGDPLSIPGVCSLDGGRYHASAPDFPAQDGDGFFPEFASWLDMGAYARRMCPVPLKTKLGCPFGCVYCTYPAGEGRSYRLFRPEDVAAAVQKLYDEGVRDIEFVDNVFNSPHGHALDVCRALAEDRTGARFHTVELNPAFTDEPLLEAMRRAGFASMGVTAESADDGVLKSLGKNYDSRRLESAADAVAGCDIPCMWLFMLGGPGETKESVERTLDFARRRVKASDIAFFNLGVRLYPGTVLETQLRNGGAELPSPQEMLSPCFYLSPGVEKDWLLEKVNALTSEELNFMGPDSLAFPFLSGLYGIAHFAGFRPPLWKHTRLLRRALRGLGMNA